MDALNQVAKIISLPTRQGAIFNLSNFTFIDVFDTWVYHSSLELFLSHQWSEGSTIPTLQIAIPNSDARIPRPPAGEINGRLHSSQHQTLHYQQRHPPFFQLQIIRTCTKTWWDRRLADG